MLPSNTGILDRHEGEAGDPQSIRAAIYARTSSHSQKFGFSLSEQTRRCIERCNLLEWEVSYIFRDEAESGKDVDRRMFQKMMECAEGGGFDVVVFWKLDRFSRSLLHAVQLEAELRKFGVALYSSTEQIDTTNSAGRFNFRSIASAAEFERDMIKERSKMGLKALAAEYGWPNDKPPLGYQKTSGGQLEIVEDEAQVVKTIFERYIYERSMPTVADWLNTQGYSTKMGNMWTARAVGEILRNQIYIGEYSVANVEATVEEYRILDREVFKEVVEIRNRFQSNNVDRAKMPEDRKDRLVEGVLEQYRRYLSQESN